MRVLFAAVPAATTETATLITTTTMPYTSGELIQLAEDATTTITIVVTAESSATTQYTVALARNPTNDEAYLFAVQLVQADGKVVDASTTNSRVFNATVSSETTRVQVVVPQGGVSPRARFQIQGQEVGADGNVDLALGIITPLTIMVTSGDNMTTNVYTLRISRPFGDNLESVLIADHITNDVLELIDGSKLSRDIVYLVTVAAPTTQLSITATLAANSTGATIRFKDGEVANGESITVDLDDEGKATIPIVVTPARSVNLTPE